MLHEAEAGEYAADIKAWYDGYHFGDFDDLLSLGCDELFGGIFSIIPRRNSWVLAEYPADNAIIRSFIDYAGSNITRKLETLLAGGFIIQIIDENLTYDYLHSSEENLWSVLYLTGYLTKMRESELSQKLPNGTFALTIPNAEIREIFEKTVVRWFSDSAKNWNRKALFEAVWKGDNENLTREMNLLLRKTISYHDYREDFYHAFLAGIFAGAGYTVESNREHGEGRSDVVVYDSVNGKAAVLKQNM